jgi:hypothetical protein
MTRLVLLISRKRIAIDSDWMLRALRLGIDFKKAPVHNFMATGGISSRQWHKGQIEYMASLLAHGYLTHVPWQLRFRKWLQSHYLRLGLDKLRARGRMQTALCLIAALNLFNRCMPIAYSTQSGTQALWHSKGQRSGDSSGREAHGQRANLCRRRHCDQSRYAA